MRYSWYLCVLLCVALPACATVFRHGQTLTIPAGEVIADDLVVSGSTVHILGKVTGNLVAAGGTVDCAGPVGGSLIVAGGTVDIRGPVAASVYAAAGTLAVHTEIGNNLTIAAGTLTVDPGTRVHRDLTLSAGDATVGAIVGRNVLANAGTLRLDDNAHIDGSLMANTNRPRIAAGAMVLGQRSITSPAPSRGARHGFAGWALWQVLTGIALFIAGTIFVATAPLLTTETETMLRHRPWASLLAGLVLLLLGLPLFVVLLVTIIGIPLAFIWLWLYGTAIFLSPIFLAILVGQAILHRPAGQLYTALLLGIVLLIIARLIPILGFVITLAAILLGLGSFILALQARTAHPAPPAAVAT